MGAEEEAVVREMCRLWATRDADAMAELFASDALYDNVPNRAPMRGREAIREYLRTVFAHVGVEPQVLHLASAGEWVLSERIDTHVAGARRMPLPVMNASQVVAGKLTVWRDYYDRRMVDDLGITMSTGTEHA